VDRAAERRRASRGPHLAPAEVEISPRVVLSRLSDLHLTHEPEGSDGSAVRTDAARPQPAPGSDSPSSRARPVDTAARSGGYAGAGACSVMNSRTVTLGIGSICMASEM
jgi:hypothetical protein